MNRLIWLGPLLSVFFYAGGALGEDGVTARHVDADASNHAVVSWEESDWPSEPTAESVWPNDIIGSGAGVQPCSCSECTRKPNARDLWSGYGCEKKRAKGRKQCRQIYVGVEYLNWWSSGQDLPALIAGGDGLPPNPTLFGGEEVGEGYQAAVRVTGGYWLDNCQEAGLVVRGFGAEGSEVGSQGQSNGTPAFSIPYINDGSNPATAGTPGALVLADAGILQSGVPASVRAQASNDIFGGDVFYRKLLGKGCGYRLDWLAGYQYSNIDDQVFLATSTNRNTLGNPRFTTFDLFNADNHYNAGEFGVLFEGTRGPLTIQLMGKIGLGNMNQEVSIRGANTVNGAMTGGGIFAQDQSLSGGPNFNVGTFERDEFAWSPELNAKTIWCLRKNLDLTIGYTFIYWSDVALAGDHIDTRVNPDVLFNGPFVPGGGSNPSFAFNDTDYWVHSFDLGLLWRY